MRPDLRGAIVAAEDAILRDGLRGRLTAGGWGTVVAVWFVSTCSTTDTRRALEIAARVLSAAEWDAQVMPWPLCVRVMATTADLIDADAPKGAEDGGEVEPTSETVIECADEALQNAAE